MPKRQLTAVEQFQLRQALHIATLSALLSAQRWAPHDLIFQGGTSLHLSHGSPRYSEDLDFLVKQSLDVASINSHIESQLKYLPWIPAEGVLSVTHTKSGRNPHAFNVVIGGENLIPAVKVKVELWKTPDRAMTPLDVQVSSVQATVGLAAGMRVAVPTATQAEIYVHKVFALAARDFLKPRDMFDLHWLKEQDSSHHCTPEALALRLEAYPSNMPHDWTIKALKRLSDLPEQAAFIGNDLKKWLPSIYPIDVQAMITTAIQALDDGMACMRQVRQASGSYDEASKR